MAEYHENLQHVLTFLTVSGIQAGVELEAEVVPHESSSDDHRAQLLLRCGASTSQRLALPAPVTVGRAQVNVVGGRHFQVKLAVTPSASPRSQTFDTDAELDATRFQHIKPTSFICASCSLPLVRGSVLHRYRDLPSEHWAELVDAWMCHADQKLHEHVQKGSKEGFWPADSEALVGGSYLLLRESAVVKVNLCEVQGPDASDASKVIMTSISAAFCSGFGPIRKSALGIPPMAVCWQLPVVVWSSIEALAGFGAVKDATGDSRCNGRITDPLADTKRPRAT